MSYNLDQTTLLSTEVLKETPYLNNLITQSFQLI